MTTPATIEYTDSTGRRVRASYEPHPVGHLVLRCVETRRKLRPSPLMSRQQYEDWVWSLTANFPDADVQEIPAST